MSGQAPLLNMGALKTCIEITVPMRYMDVLCDGNTPIDPVPLAVSAITRQAGGVTYTEARGQWYNDTDQLVEEDVIVYKWWFSGDRTTGQSVDRVNTLICALLEAGEKAVLMQESDARGVEACIFTPYTPVTQLRD